MPELPEVEVLRRTLEPRLLGQRIESVEVRQVSLREPVAVVALEKAVAGRKILAVRRRSKYLLIDLEGGQTLVIHLGMSGRLTVVPAAEPLEPHEHVSFRLGSASRLRFRDPRRFGLVLALPTAELERDRHFAELGVEPFSPEFSGEGLQAAAQRRRGPVKAFLMDASVVVGVGNIYASEALFQAGVHPLRSVARISRGRWQQLAEAVRQVLARAIEEGGTTLNDFADADGQSGYFQVSLAVYDREGKPCRRCGAAIRRVVLANRSTYYCPRCQT
ncbi:MAG: bifunctional DNA-formamidopyrimidine glycosylase/DNA-(apurinic or apyrimidinic site) lyase [Thermoanaerobaculia bacterium]